MNKKITGALKVLKQGGIVIFPTDTAFGIGCRMDDAEAMKKLYSIRKRPASMAVPVLFDSVEQVEEYTTDVPKIVKKDLMEKYWPGALTITLSAQLEKVPELVRGGGLSIGARIPAHETPLELIRGLGVPLIGTSANFHGEPTPYKLADINPRLISLVDDLVPGTTLVGKESTVIDCTVTPWKVLRQGAVEL